MDLQKLAGTLLSSDSVKGLSKLSGVSSKNVKNILSEALPSLLNGADAQAKNSDTTESFAAALTQHAKSDTGNLAGFLKNVDLSDGAKIIGHLLGSDSDSTTAKVAKKAGVSTSKTNTVLSAAAPLLMSLLGKQAEEDDGKDSGVADLMGSLLSNVDIGDVLTGLLGGNNSGSKPSGSNLLSGLLKLFKK